jgi:hypothetical protein
MRRIFDFTAEKECKVMLYGTAYDRERGVTYKAKVPKAAAQFQFGMQFQNGSHFRYGLQSAMGSERVMLCEVKSYGRTYMYDHVHILRPEITFVSAEEIDYPSIPFEQRRRREIIKSAEDYLSAIQERYEHKKRYPRTYDVILSGWRTLSCESGQDLKSNIMCARFTRLGEDAVKALESFKALTERERIDGHHSSRYYSPEQLLKADEAALQLDICYDDVSPDGYRFELKGIEESAEILRFMGVITPVRLIRERVAGLLKSGKVRVRSIKWVPLKDILPAHILAQYPNA